MQLLGHQKFDLGNNYSLVVVRTDKFGATAALFQGGNPLWAGDLKKLKDCVGIDRPN